MNDRTTEEWSLPERIEPDAAHLLLTWYDRFGRDLPWRRTRDAYRIWISEIILQQTRVSQGRDYYLRFIDRFADVASLAAADRTEVLRLWQGLGYYSRARNLHAAARQVVGQMDGRFPTDYDRLRTLPGVGDYTAAAVASIAADAPCAVVDGNVCRVLARLYDVPHPIDTAAGRRIFRCLADRMLDRSAPGAYNQAVMDFGAMVCTPRSPACGDCPLAGRCRALAGGTVEVRPCKQGRVRQRERRFCYLDVHCGGERLLRQRCGQDIWQGLYEFPMAEVDADADADWETLRSVLESVLPGAGSLPAPTGRKAMPAHLLSHQVIRALFLRFEVDAFPAELARGALRVDADRLDRYPLSRLTLRYLGR